MIRVGRPWNLMLLLEGPGPFSLMHLARSNKSSSQGDTDGVLGEKYGKREIKSYNVSKNYGKLGKNPGKRGHYIIFFPLLF
jgi:hypothetical protein